MSNATLFIAGSIHQGHAQFSDISRGRQCCYMSFSALLCAQSSSTTANGVHMYFYSRSDIDRRRQHVLEYFWKTQYPRYRDAVADLSAWSSSMVFAKPIAHCQLLNRIYKYLFNWTIHPGVLHQYNLHIPGIFQVLYLNTLKHGGQETCQGLINHHCLQHCLAPLCETACFIDYLTAENITLWHCHNSVSLKCFASM